MDGEAPVFHVIRLFSVSIRRDLFILSKLLGEVLQSSPGFPVIYTTASRMMDTGRQPSQIINIKAWPWSAVITTGW